ncbi:MAG: hypothetical protein ACR652_09305 [Methylocystis sp.]|uniref:hypothetical protein n=1 Tax=Methylocystis sp. TaxID=1911079 RepID=UPI003DA3B336
MAYFPKPDFVTSNFLYVTIPHPDWGAKAGDYVSDYRTPSATGVSAWSFVIHSDLVGATVRIRMQTDKQTFANCVLNDVSANRGYPLSMADFFAGVSVTMDSTDKSMQLVCKNS